MVRNLLLITILITIFTTALFSQEVKQDPEQEELQTVLTPAELIKEGVDLHDEGEYEEAIDRYNEALEQDSTLIEAIYEMSLSYLALEDFENALQYSTQVIESENENLSPGAYAVKGEALTGMEKDDEAIRLLYEGLEVNGDEFLLHFNLALIFFKKGDLDNTLLHIKKAIDLEKSQSGAFLLNAYAMNDNGMWVQSILSFQMFLLLEPDSKRSKNAFAEMLQIMQITEPEEPIERSFIQQQMLRNSNIDTTNTKELPPLTTQNGLNRQEVYDVITQTIDSLKATTKDSEEELNEFTVFKSVNMEMMKNLEKQSKGVKEGILWTFYIPFFSCIAHSDYYDTFTRYISVSYYPESFRWWEENPDAAFNFAVWFEEGDNT